MVMDEFWHDMYEEPPYVVGDEGYTGYLVYVNGYVEVADYTVDKFDDVPCFHVDGEYEPDVEYWAVIPRTPY